MPDVKLCKDCKHFRRRWSAFLPFLIPIGGQIAFIFMGLGAWRDAHRFAKCARSVREWDTADTLVSDRCAPLQSGMHYCSTERQFSCGREAKFFEARK